MSGHGGNPRPEHLLPPPPLLCLITSHFRHRRLIAQKRLSFVEVDF